MKDFSNIKAVNGLAACDNDESVYHNATNHSFHMMRHSDVLAAFSSKTTIVNIDFGDAYQKSLIFLDDQLLHGYLKQDRLKEKPVNIKDGREHMSIESA